ncbi:MAG: hypothetical protein WB992_03365 [Bryobacteraceae bacterium]
MAKGIFLALFFVAFTALLRADTLVLRNGSRIEGSFVGGDNHVVRFAVGNQVNTYNLNDIDSIRFSGAPESDAPPAPPDSSANPPNPGFSQTVSSPPPQSRPPETYAAPASAPPSSGPVGIQVPAGTQIVVRLIDGANSEIDSLGQTYRASIDQPVVVNGQTVIPRGSDVIATLVDTQKSGKIEGRAILTLDLKSVAVNGRTYNIVTTGVAESSASRGQKSAKVIGGTAALGALIGGIAGGGRGAAIGAGSGAAVGTAAQVATSGQKVKVPAETRLTFTLQNPIDL